MTKFVKGDIVRLKTGTSRIVVVDLIGSIIPMLRGYYEGSKIDVLWRAASDFELLMEMEELAAMERSDAKVVSTTLDPYPHRDKWRSKSTGFESPYIGFTTKGLLVLENKYGCPFSVDNEDWEKVVPFTFSIQWENGVKREFAGNLGDVAVGDQLLHDSGYSCTVMELNTKSRATERFIGKRYVLEDLS